MEQRIVKKVFLSILLASFLLASANAQTVRGAETDALAQAAATVNFSGLVWDVREGSGGPGPNLWKSSNVWVDARGYLHLRITYQNGKWYCAQLSTRQKFGFGTYQWQILSRVDAFDPNVVLGLFNYPTPDVGPDATNEIDIEFSHWGDADYPIGNYTVWPAVSGLKQRTKTFDFTLGGSHGLSSTHKFTWSSTQVRYRSQYGLRNDNLNTFATWTYAPADSLRYIPQDPMKVYINLWLMLGRPPMDGQTVVVVIKNFKFTPQ
jgi:beta-glucanase (GH16 family)